MRSVLVGSILVFQVLHASAIPLIEPKPHTLYANYCAGEELAYITDLGSDKSEVLWNGTPVDLSTLESYVKELRSKIQSYNFSAYFEWSGPEREPPASIISILKRYGFNEHNECPRLIHNVN